MLDRDPANSITAIIITITTRVFRFVLRSGIFNHSRRTPVAAAGSAERTCITLLLLLRLLFFFFFSVSFIVVSSHYVFTSRKRLMSGPALKTDHGINVVLARFTYVPSVGKALRPRARPVDAWDDGARRPVRYPIREAVARTVYDRDGKSRKTIYTDSHFWHRVLVLRTSRHVKYKMRKKLTPDTVENPTAVVTRSRMSWS